MGELLSDSEFSFCMETRTWDCISFTSDSSGVVQVRFPKNSKNGACQFVDIFKIKDSSVCPFESLRNLMDSNTVAVATNQPVFAFSLGTFLSTTLFTKTLRALLYPHLSKNVYKLSSHSF